MPADCTPDETDAPVGLGSACPGQFMKGVIDEAIIIDIALEQEDIEEMMDGLVQYLAVEFHGKLASAWGAINVRH